MSDAGLSRPRASFHCVRVRARFLFFHVVRSQWKSGQELSFSYRARVLHRKGSDASKRHFANEKLGGINRIERVVTSPVRKVRTTGSLMQNGDPQRRLAAGQSTRSPEFRVSWNLRRAVTLKDAL